MGTKEGPRTCSSFKGWISKHRDDLKHDTVTSTKGTDVDTRFETDDEDKSSYLFQVKSSNDSLPTSSWLGLHSITKTNATAPKSGAIAKFKDAYLQADKEKKTGHLPSWLIKKGWVSLKNEEAIILDTYDDMALILMLDKSTRTVNIMSFCP